MWCIGYSCFTEGCLWTKRWLCVNHGVVQFSVVCCVHVWVSLAGQWLNVVYHLVYSVMQYFHISLCKLVRSDPYIWMRNQQTQTIPFQTEVPAEMPPEGWPTANQIEANLLMFNENMHSLSSRCTSEAKTHTIFPACQTWWGLSLFYYMSVRDWFLCWPIWISEFEQNWQSHACTT